MSTLRERIIELLNTTELADPRELAEKLLPDLDDDEREEALRSILPGYVREIIRAHRFGGGHCANETHATTAPSIKFDRGQFPYETQSAAAPVNSRKVREIRTRWQSFLNGRLEGADGWVLMARATVADLEAAATFREQQAERNATTALKLRTLARALKANHVNAVADLPEAEGTALIF